MKITYQCIFWGILMILALGKDVEAVYKCQNIIVKNLSVVECWLGDTKLNKVDSINACKELGAELKQDGPFENITDLWSDKTFNPILNQIIDPIKGPIELNFPLYFERSSNIDDICITTSKMDLPILEYQQIPCTTPVKYFCISTGNFNYNTIRKTMNYSVSAPLQTCGANSAIMKPSNMIYGNNIRNVIVTTEHKIYDSLRIQSTSAMYQLYYDTVVNAKYIPRSIITMDSLDNSCFKFTKISPISANKTMSFIMNVDCENSGIFQYICLNNSVLTSTSKIFDSTVCGGELQTSIPSGSFNYGRYFISKLDTFCRVFVNEFLNYTPGLEQISCQSTNIKKNLCFSKNRISNVKSIKVDNLEYFYRIDISSVNVQDSTQFSYCKSFGLEQIFFENSNMMFTLAAAFEIDKNEYLTSLKLMKGTTSGASLPNAINLNQFPYSSSDTVAGFYYEPPIDSAIDQCYAMTPNNNIKMPFHIWKQKNCSEPTDVVCSRNFTITKKPVVNIVQMEGNNKTNASLYQSNEDGLFRLNKDFCSPPFTLTVKFYPKVLLDTVNLSHSYLLNAQMTHHPQINIKDIINNTIDLTASLQMHLFSVVPVLPDTSFLYKTIMPRQNFVATQLFNENSNLVQMAAADSTGSTFKYIFQNNKFTETSSNTSFNSIPLKVKNDLYQFLGHQWTIIDFQISKINLDFSLEASTTVTTNDRINISIPRLQNILPPTIITNDNVNLCFVLTKIPKISKYYPKQYLLSLVLETSNLFKGLCVATTIPTGSNYFEWKPNNYIYETPDKFAKGQKPSSCTLINFSDADDVFLFQSKFIFTETYYWIETSPIIPSETLLDSTLLKIEEIKDYDNWVMKENSCEDSATGLCFKQGETNKYKFNQIQFYYENLGTITFSNYQTACAEGPRFYELNEYLFFLKFMPSATKIWLPIKKVYKQTAAYTALVISYPSLFQTNVYMEFDFNMKKSQTYHMKKINDAPANGTNYIDYIAVAPNYHFDKLMCENIIIETITTTETPTTTTTELTTTTTQPTTTTASSTTASTTSASTTSASTTSASTTSASTTSASTTSASTTSASTTSATTTATPTATTVSSTTTPPSTTSSSTIVTTTVKTQAPDTTTTSLTTTTASTTGTTTVISSVSTSSTTSQSTTNPSTQTTTASVTGSTTTIITTEPPPVDYGLPTENKLNIKYSSTANHYWYFNKTTQKVFDNGTNATFLYDHMLERFKRGSKSHLIATEKDLSLFKPVGNDLAVKAPLQVKDGMFKDDSGSVEFPGGDLSCLDLFQLSTDNRYISSCLEQPQSCEYGFSISVWIKFLKDNIQREEIIAATGPRNNQGFMFYYGSGYLTAKVIGRKYTWIGKYLMEKHINSWVVIGFTWRSFTGDMKILIGSDLITITPDRIVNEMVPGLPTTFNLGCIREPSNLVDGSTTTNSAIAHVAFWAWPVQEKAILTGSVVYSLVREEIPSTTPGPTTVAPNRNDFSRSIVNMVAQTNDLNPIYTTADIYVTPELLSDAQISGTFFGRKGYKLGESNSILKLPTSWNLKDKCPQPISSCSSGFSTSFWIYIEDLAGDGDILDIYQTFKIDMYNKELYFKLYNGTSYITGIKTKDLVQGIWQNIGFTWNKEKIKIFINGIIDNTALIVSQPPKGLSAPLLNMQVGEFLIGSAYSETKKMVYISDWVIRRRFLLDFEAHNFVGYTLSQFLQLTTATNYWTPDTYINADSKSIYDRFQSNNVTIKLKSSLTSLLQPRNVNFDMEMDPYSKSNSQCPVFKQNWDHYMFLGRQKFWENSFSDNDINWSGHCLTDPCITTCRGNGLTISFWLKIKSASISKIQFYLNTGDLADSMGSYDGRGVSIFTNQKLLGISVSTCNSDWNIIIDSNKYQIDQWMNIGILWREDLGLRLIIDGIDYSLLNKIPDIRTKNVDIGIRAVLNRFDFDNVASWPTQSIWEMGNYVFGESSYIDRYMTPLEYSSMLALNENSLFASVSWMRMGESLVDLPIVELINSPKSAFNYNGLLDWDNDRKSIDIKGNGTTIPIFVNNTKCPIKLSACTNGFSIGGWFYLSEGFPTTEFNLFSQGILEDGDSFGIKIKPGRLLTAWVRYNNEQWLSEITNLNFQDTLNGWNFIGLEWKDDVGLLIIVNGEEIASNSKQQVTKKKDITDNNVYISDTKLILGINDKFMVRGIIFHESFLNTVQLPKLLGITTEQILLLKKSTLYWAISGLYGNLIKPKIFITEVSVSYTKNKAGRDNSAICTTGSDMSYIDFYSSRINQSVINCLQNPDLCKSFVLIANIKFFPLFENVNKGYLLMTGTDTSGTKGVTIYQSNNNKSTIILRSGTRYCLYNISISTFNEWVQLKLIWQLDKNPIVKINEQLETFTPICKDEINNAIKTTPISMGRKLGEANTGVQFCISDLMLIHITSNKDPDSVAGGLFDSSCYENMDIFFKLDTDQDDNYGVSKKASLIKNANFSTIPYSCLNDPGKCKNGLSISLWVKIVQSINKDENLFVIGIPNKPGIAIILSPGTNSNKLTIKLHVHTGTKQWKLSKIDGLQINEWTNIGLVWSQLGSSGLTLFINGQLNHSSTIFEQDKLSDLTPSTKVDISTELIGIINDVSVWFQIVATCQSPRLSQKVITGSCKEDITLEIQKKCNLIENCEKALGPICMDETEKNVENLSKTIGIITSLNDGVNVLKVVNNVLKKTNEPSTNLIKYSIDLLINAANHTIIVDNIPANDLVNITDSFCDLHDELMNGKYEKNWNEMINNNQYKLYDMIEQMDQFYLRLASNMNDDCTSFASVKTIIALSLLKLDTRKDKCSTIELPDYNDKKWTENTNWKESQDKFTIYKPKIDSNGPVISIASTIYQNSKLFASTTSNLVSDDGKIKYTINSNIISIKTNPIINRVEGEPLIELNQKFKTPNQRKERLQKWESKEEQMNLDLKYQWSPVYWLIANDNSTSDSWDSLGCTKLSWNTTHVIYKVDHMTGFSVLMEPTEQNMSTIDKEILTYITYIGLGLSIFFLLIFLITIISSPYLKGTRYVIHINLGIALLLASIAFILADYANSNKQFCQAIGILTHFFYLSTFSWLFIEGIFVFHAIINGNVDNRLKCYLPVGWGIPLIIVITTAALSIDSYGRNDFCWLSYQNYYMWAFLGPLYGFLIVTVIVCLIVACNIGTPIIKGDLLDDVRDNVKQTAITIPIMLTGWAIGAAYIYTYSMPLAYIFTIICSLEGLWVFLFFGIMNPDFRAALCRRERMRHRANSSLGILDSIHSTANSNASLRSRNTVGPMGSGAVAPVYYAAPPQKSRPPRHMGSADFSTDNVRASNRQLIQGNSEIEVDSTIVRNDGIPKESSRTVPGTPQYEE